MNRIIACSGVVGSLALATVFGNSIVFATENTDIVDQINITVPVSCTLSGTNLLHNTTMQNNQYKTDIGSANMKTTCNDTNGYAIYAIGYTDETDGNNKMHSSTLGSTYDIATGKYVSGTTTNSVWSMKLTPVSGTYAPTIRNDASYNYTNYEVVPSSYTKVVSLNSATDVGTGSVGSNFTTNYAIFVNQTQPAGTYTGKVKFTLVHPQNEVPAQPVACEGGKICYNPNTALVEGQMGKQTAGNNASVTLYASNFKRDGYGFVGWNDKYDYTGNFYGPNQTITAPSDVSTKGLSLYAVWVKSAGTIQNWNGCSSLTKANEATDIFSQSITALTDERDGNTYAVAKLADSKCWMIENLRLADKDANNNDINLSSTNTHNPSLPLTNSWWFSTANDSDTKPTSNHLSVTTDPTQTAWCTTISSNCDDQSMLATNNTTLFTSNTASSYSASSNVYSYGNYYNWYSATAGHGKYGSNYGSSFTSPGDICPAGWHLPTGKDATGEFGLLDIALGGTGATSSSSTTPTGATMSGLWRSYPNNFVYSGYVSGSSVYDRNSYGKYWSASVDAYYLTFGSTYVDPGALNTTKYYGWMVRCAAGV